MSEDEMSDRKPDVGAGMDRVRAERSGYSN